MAESEVGPWAQDKLERLQKYLSAYTTIMRKQDWCSGYVYVDAFAGPGEHRLRQRLGPATTSAESLFEFESAAQEDSDQQQFVAGSPRVALEIDHPFRWYVFVESDVERVKQLEQLGTEFGETRKVVVRQEDCNGYLLDKVVNNPKISWQTWRGVVFLDPFGMQVPWSTIEALGKTGAIEVFLNLPVGMAIQRLLPRSGKFTAKERAKLDEYFGSPEWHDLLYPQVTDLLDDGRRSKIGDSGRVLVQWYRKRLKQCFGYASKAALIRNSKGGHLYYLMLATPNRNGLKIANDILQAGEYV